MSDYIRNLNYGQEPENSHFINIDLIHQGKNQSSTSSQKKNDQQRQNPDNNKNENDPESIEFESKDATFKFYNNYDNYDLESIDSSNFIKNDKNLNFLLMKDRYVKENKQKKNSSECSNQTSNTKGRNMQATYSQSRCPEPELYVTSYLVTNNAANSKLEVQDHKIRSTDQSQIVVGTYWESSTRRHCFLAKLDHRGYHVNSGFLENNNAAKYSECYAVAITTNNEVVAVGTYFDSSAANAGSAALIIKNEYYNGDTKANELDDTTRTRVRIWSHNLVQTGKDVAVTMDGGIYITGSVKSPFSHGGWDCFIMRLNHTLDRVYVKSFGTDTYDEQCSEVQVTRNNDYIYLAGSRVFNTNTELMFFKLSAHGDEILYSKYMRPVAANYKFTIRRLLMTETVSFSGVNDNNELFFCGQTDHRSGDIYFGKMDFQLNIQSLHRYGSVSDEKIGDCTITKDASNRFMVISFATNHYKPRSSAIQDISSTITSAYQPSYFGDVVRRNTETTRSFGGSTEVIDCSNNSPQNPQVNGIGGSSSKCPLVPVFPDPTTINQITNACGAGFTNNIVNYASEYTNNVYTWTTCEPYFFNFDSLTCTVNVDWYAYMGCFSDTNGQMILGPYKGDYPCQGNSVNCQTAETVYLSCDDILQKYGLSSTSSFLNDNQKNLIKKYAYDNLKIANVDSLWKPFWFCDVNNGNAQYDDYFSLVYEQDCLDNDLINNPTKKAQQKISYDWFVMKVLVSDMTDATKLNSMPFSAAYFGDRDNDEYPTSIQVDDLGYITIHGTTDSDEFGVNNANQQAWLHARTHWNMHIEWRINNGVGFNSYPNHGTNPPRNYRKRFVQPRKFRNNHGITFMYDINTVSERTYADLVFEEQPLPINEDVRTINSNMGNGVGGYDYESPFFSDYPNIQTRFFGFSYYSMNNQLEFKMIRNQEFQKSMPYFCVDDDYGVSWINRKYSAVNPHPVTGVTISANSSDPSSAGTLTGAPTVAEGVYYIDYIATALNEFNFANDYYCPLNGFWYFQNTDTLESMNRFTIYQRLKVTVDDLYVDPPSNTLNINDMYIKMGHRYNSEDVRPKFTNYATECAYYYAKQSRMTNAPRSTMLPWWMQFHEQNGTFTMYAPYDETSGYRSYNNQAYHIEVFCCNKIDECVINTFTVNVTNTDPPQMNLALIPSEYILQFDTAASLGEHLDWSQSLALFYDINDQITDTQDPYNHQSHTIRVMRLTSSQFMRSINWIGMAYFNCVNSRKGLTTSVQFQMKDQFSTYEDVPPVNTNYKFWINIFCNQKPQPTAAGIAYTFPNINLDVNIIEPTTEFDEEFPFLKNETINTPSVTQTQITVSTAGWFTDPDNHALSQYLSMSDGSPLPSFITFNRNTQTITIAATCDDASQLVKLKMTVYDTKKGINYLFKDFLINCWPRAKAYYKTFVVVKNKQFTIDIGQFFEDMDGDKLTVTIANSSQEQILNYYDIKFTPTNNKIAGRVTTVRDFSYIKFQATDPHGAYAILYVTIRVKDAEPERRDKNIPRFPDKYVSGGTIYAFNFPDYLFYDQKYTEPLITYASTEFDAKLPSWIQYSPYSRTFFGLAPNQATSQRVQMRAMHPLSHDSVTSEFTIYVIPNSVPSSNVEFWPAYTNAEIGQFFKMVIPYSAFSDVEINVNPKLSMQGAFGEKMESWIKFNPFNGTVYGVAKKQGVYMMDITFEDDQGMKAYCNLKLTVGPKTIPSNSTGTFIFSAFVLCGLCVYMAYTVHYMFLQPLKVTNLQLRMKEAQKRFGAFKDVNIQTFAQSDDTHKYTTTGKEPVLNVNESMIYGALN